MRSHSLLIVWFLVEVSFSYSLNKVASLKYSKLPPIKLNSHCFINWVVESQDAPSHYSHPLPFSNGGDGDEGDYHSTKTVFNPFHLNFNIEKDTLLDITAEPLTLQDHYFRYTLKHAGNCIIFYLQTNTVNGTLSAIHNSGYSTSDWAIFFIELNLHNTEIVEVFRKGVESSEMMDFITPFFASIIFRHEIVSGQELEFTTYCHHCPLEIGKIQRLIKTTNYNRSAVSLNTLKSLCSSWNQNGYESEAYLHFVMVEGTYNLNMNVRTIIELNRKNYKSLHKLSMAGILMWQMVTKKLNLTIKNVRRFNINEEGPIEWTLNIKWWEFQLTASQNVWAQARGAFLPVLTHKQMLVYCQNASTIREKNLDIYVKPFDSLTWLFMFLVCFILALMYQNLCKGMDLLWPLIGIPTTYFHNRKILYFYLTYALLLSIMYDSEMSTEFITMDTSITTRELTQLGYRLLGNIPPFIQLAKRTIPRMYKVICDFAGTTNFNEVYRNDYYTIPNGNVSVKLAAMIQEKVILFSATLGYQWFGSLLFLLSRQTHTVILWNNPQAIVCGRFLMPEALHVTHSEYYRLWGFFSGRAYKLYSRMEQGGIPEWLKYLVDYSKFLKIPLQWSSNQYYATEYYTIDLDSPVGVVCMVYFGVLVGFAVVFSIVKFKLRGTTNFCKKVRAELFDTVKNCRNFEFCSVLSRNNKTRLRVISVKPHEEF
ncbi:unnamed protein product [Orchesella dallaii]|uniref:Uncharacterized protein n=1 Tax=Orchesella dallaii TaxID=48710 RepID=A0ABP1S8A9_9HEXA